ncbi:MAG: response regulator [Acidobacteriota bacterium]
MNRPKKKRNLIILLVEDENIVTLDIQRMLNNLGHRVEYITPRGEEAVDMVKEIKPDLILMDIKLQGEIDGIEAARRIRSQLYTPIIYISALSDEETRKKAGQYQPCLFLSKPIEEKDLQKAIWKIQYERV